MAGHMDGGQGMVVHEQIVVGDMSGHGQAMGDHTMEGQMVVREGHEMAMGEMAGHTSKREAEYDYEGYDY